MTLSPMDDYPIHQIAEVVRHVGTSDRNFYDRYYFNCYPIPTEGTTPLFLIVGLGQYPNLGVTDAFAVVRRGDDHVLFRASKALGDDRMDLAVGPLRVEVLEGLRRLRVVLEPGGHSPDLSFDLTFTAHAPASLEARHHLRQLERVTFDTQRFVQSGTWSGTLVLDGETMPVDDATWRGNRDRSWGVRPVGEAEPPGRRASPEVAATHNFFWIYTVMQFDDVTVTSIMQEDIHGRRLLEDATWTWVDPARDERFLGRPDHDIEFVPGTRECARARLTFRRPGRPGEPDTTVTVDVEPILPHYLGVGTGYGLEPDWRHGMWQGELVTGHDRMKVEAIDAWKKMFCPVDALARFVLTDPDAPDGITTRTGTGLFEFGVIGPYPRYGFESMADTAP